MLCSTIGDACHRVSAATQNTSLITCQNEAPVPVATGTPSDSCILPSQFMFALEESTCTMPGQEGLQCPKLLLASSRSSDPSNQPPGVQSTDRGQQSQGPALWWWLLNSEGSSPGDSRVVASPSFFRAAGCTCEAQGQLLVPPSTCTAAQSSSNSSSSSTCAAAESSSSSSRSGFQNHIWTCEWPDGFSPEAARHFKKDMVISSSLAIVLPWVALLVGWWVYRWVSQFLNVACCLFIFPCEYGTVSTDLCLLTCTVGSKRSCSYLHV